MKNLESFKSYETDLRTIVGGNRPRVEAITLEARGIHRVIKPLPSDACGMGLCAH